MKAPLLEELIKYHKEENLLLSMPGNKAGKGFMADRAGKEFMENMGKMDITEVDPLDNLHCPEGVIKESQELLADLYKSEKAYFCVNGSSCGNLSSIFSAFNEGDEVLVERNCHKSVYNALIMRKLKAVYIIPEIETKNEVMLPANEASISEALERAENPKGIILTSPSYYGISCDLKNILTKIRKKNMKIIIDSAHGAHFGITEKLPESIIPYADYIIASAHKTLPALTQGSYIFVNDTENIEKFEFYLKAFMTTSPSYLIMASLDYARFYLEKYGEKQYNNLINCAEKWKNKINSLEKVRIISGEDLNAVSGTGNQGTCKEKYIIDKTRYIMTVPENFSGHKLLKYLRKEKIQCEMSFSRGVILIWSPFNDDNDFEKVYNSINKLNMEEIYDIRFQKEKNSENYNAQSKKLFKGKTSAEKNDLNCKENISLNAPCSLICEKILEPYEVFNKKSEKCLLEECEGKTAKDFIIPYPPGIPAVCPGEKISNHVIAIIKEYNNYRKDVIGIIKDEDGRIYLNTVFDESSENR